MIQQLQTSAQIYQFPKGGRRSLQGGQPVLRPISAEAISQRAILSAGESWYHAEAIAAAAKELQPA